MVVPGSTKLKPVLYVEDEENDIFFMERAFKVAEVENALLTLTDGQQALDYLEGNGRFADRAEYPLPCVLLLDLNLPLKTGLELLKWLRAQPSLATLPVIVFTSSSQSRDIQAAYELGANAYLVKPSTPDKLEQTVRIIKEFWLHENRPPPGRDAIEPVV